jgi:hypothetical protein
MFVRGDSVCLTNGGRDLVEGRYVLGSRQRRYPFRGLGLADRVWAAASVPNRPSPRREALHLLTLLTGVDDARMCNLCTLRLPTWEALIGLMLRGPKTDLLQSFTGSKSPPSKWIKSQSAHLEDEAPTRNAWVHEIRRVRHVPAHRRWPDHAPALARLLAA